MLTPRCCFERQSGLGREHVFEAEVLEHAHARRFFKFKDIRYRVGMALVSEAVAVSVSNPRLKKLHP